MKFKKDVGVIIITMVVMGFFGSCWNAEERDYGVYVEARDLRIF